MGLRTVVYDCQVAGAYRHKKTPARFWPVFFYEKSLTQ